MTNMSESALAPLGKPLPFRGGVGAGGVRGIPASPDSPHPSIPSPEGEGKWVAQGVQKFAPSSGFRSDARFAAPSPAPAHPGHPPEDPLTQAFADGFASGAELARAEARAEAETLAQAREALSLAFTRLDAALAEQLRQHLRDTVAALCEAALAPMALDEDALLSRIERALALFARADDERVIRLNPEDIALVAPRFAADWQVLPDPALERGALRVEAANGGVEDGPAQWRLAIAEALDE